jgi:hypothetical protein
MRRDQLEHAIRAACQIIDRPEVIVLGSQAILGTFREDELPVRATMSGEVDILPIAGSNEETARLADRIEGVADRTGTKTLTLAPSAEIEMPALPQSRTRFA